MNSINSTELLGKRYDGVTHIRIHMDAATPLGRFLATVTPVVLQTEHGRFQSIEGYYRYRRYLECLRLADVPMETFIVVLGKLEPLRDVSGKNAIKVGGDVHASLYSYTKLNLKMAPTEDQAQDIQRAIIQKFKAHPNFMNIALDNQLPLTAYYEDSKDGRIVCNGRFSWYPHQVMLAIDIIKGIYQ